MIGGALVVAQEGAEMSQEKEGKKTRKKGKKIAWKGRRKGVTCLARDLS